MNSSSSRQHDAAITARLAEAARALSPHEVVPLTARFGARYIATRAAAAIAAHAVLDALAEAVGRDNPHNFDAAIIACFGDPALDAAREMLPIPVLGLADASIAAALRLAPTISLLTAAPPGSPCCANSPGRAATAPTASASPPSPPPRPDPPRAQARPRPPHRSRGEGNRRRRRLHRPRRRRAGRPRPRLRLAVAGARLLQATLDALPSARPARPDAARPLDRLSPPSVG
jgi:hypothetical protein